jgi:hypothetical protein
MEDVHRSVVNQRADRTVKNLFFPQTADLLLLPVPQRCGMGDWAFGYEYFSLQHQIHNGEVCPELTVTEEIIGREVCLWAC